MNTIIKELQELQKFKEYVEEIKSNTPVISISGLSSVGKIQYIYSSFDMIKRPILIVTYNEIEARKIIDDLKNFTNNKDEIIYFPKREIATYDYVTENKDLAFQRQEILNKIEKNKAKIIVTTIEALMQKMITKDNLYKDKLNLKVGKTYTLREDLAPIGYVKSTDIQFKVENTGKVQKVTMIDKVVEMTKEDIGGNELEGAKIQVLDKKINGNINYI